MKPVNSSQKPKAHAFGALLLLAVILAVLFWKCFLPNYVQFSNDGPLGQQMAAWHRLPAAFKGCWYDLNYIGISGGTELLSVSTLIYWVFGPVGDAKFLTPIALFILGLGAWTCFRQLKLSTLAATLGALAAALISLFFSDACWGTAAHQIAFGMDFFALALIVSNSAATPWFVRWVRLALAGFAVGINVIEAADIGALFSVLIAAFTLFHAFTEDGTTAKRLGRGIGRVLVVAVFAVFLASQTIVTLVGTFGEGTVGSQRNAETNAQRWNWATQWSFPKIETMGIVVPGLFGYRMDTPRGGNYWGAIGRDPAWNRYLANDEQGSPPPGFLRFSGTGNYVGVLVFLVALWAVLQSLRRKNSIFSQTHRRFLWFWAVVLIVSLPLAFGRYAPFTPLYRFVYFLPHLHLTAVRNPIKFLFVLTFAFLIIFAYGVHGLSRRYLENPVAGSGSILAQFKMWRAKVRGFDRNWVSICVVVFIGSLLAWLIYALQKPNLVAYLKTVGFSDEELASQIAGFSIRQVGWFILFFALDAGLLALILSGAFAGRRAKWGGILLGVLLVADLGRADLPWVVFWNYPQKYLTDPIINILRNKPYEHRVAILRSQPPGNLPFYDNQFEGLYNIEWSQQLFPYYDIQSLDIIQMSRMPEDLAAYTGAFMSQGMSGIVRRWELTNTRYLLGFAPYLEALNQEFDPVQRRFHIVARFDLVLKPGVDHVTKYEQLTAVTNANGGCALFEFAGALPRAKLYSHWQISTNDQLTLKTLVRPDFDPWKSVLVSTSLPTSPTASATNENPGTVQFESYAPQDIRLSARTDVPSVLLLNSKFNPNWHVFVDGKRETLLRCNFIMRGVYLTPGAHTVEFTFSLPMGPLYVSLSAVGVGVLLCGFLFFSTRRAPTH